MHGGITPINSAAYLDPGFLRSFALQLEELGYESVWTFEHVIVPHDYQSRYPYHPSGKLGLATGSGFTDPFIALTYVAGPRSTCDWAPASTSSPKPTPSTSPSRRHRSTICRADGLNWASAWAGWKRSSTPSVCRSAVGERVPTSTSRPRGVPRPRRATLARQHRGIAHGPTRSCHRSVRRRGPSGLQRGLAAAVFSRR